MTGGVPLAMCGIVAVHGRAPATDPDLETMLDALAHRGPDGAGAVAVGSSWLGHRRLAIVDVDGGDQPLSATDGTLHLVGNGEVYNHDELRRRLPAAALSTRSDNEVALGLYRAEGLAGLARLEGMFAMAIASEDGDFVALRDPVGIKPLYWAQREGATLFASELKAFDAAWRPHVEEFPAGHAWTPEGGLTRLLPDPVPAAAELRPLGQDTPPAEVLEAVRDTLVDAVERRMMADVPVGVFLSGGLDSSLVAAIAARTLEPGQQLHTFAVGMAGSADLVAARQVADLLGTTHHEDVYTAEELAEALPDVVRCIESFDPMLVHSAVPNYLLARFAARHVKVVLTGEGADELFAGYDHHRELTDPRELHAELVAGVEGLHNLNLQRADRTSMAHGLEARVPFLDLRMVHLGLSLPARWKQVTPERREKWMLRQAFDGWLPAELLWRRKEQFGDGTGASAVLREVAEATVDEDGFRAVRGHADPPLRTREEAAYWRLFREHLDGVDVEETIGRFAVA